MVILTDRDLALRCPSCGKLNEFQISVFSFSGRRALRVPCSCGIELLVVCTRDHKSYSLQIPCSVCEESHSLFLTHQEMWSQDLVTLYCPETDMELGYLGGNEAVRDAIKAKRTPFSEILSDTDYQEFFENPEVMWEVLTKLQEFANGDGLGCQCGNTDIEIDIFADKVELRCKQCDSLMIIYSQNEEDLRLMRKTSSVKLVRGTFTSLDGRRFRGRHGKSEDR